MLNFLKLGGSLITDKLQPRTPRRFTLQRLAQEIAAAVAQQPGLKLVIGHGSGSFGHHSAQKYGTRRGVRTPEEWKGFVEVWKDARELNQIVLDALLAAGLPVLAFPPSSSVLASAGRIHTWDTTLIQRALNQGLIPLVFGDVVFDRKRGGTILSTEEQFFYLAQVFNPARILLAGIEEGVWADYPQRTRILPLITPDNFASLAETLQGSAAPDVTGGMIDKVNNMLQLVAVIPGLEALIFSGNKPGGVQQALLGASPGTCIRMD